MVIWKIAKRLEPHMSLGAFYYKVSFRKLLRLARCEPPMELLHPTWVALLEAPRGEERPPSSTERIAEALNKLSPQECEVLASGGNLSLRAR